METLATPAQSQQIFVENVFHCLAITLLYYDHILTLPVEIHHIWSRPKSTSSYWFFLNRYFGAVVNVVVTVFKFQALDPQSCESYTLFRQVFLVVNQVQVCVLLTLRIYALYGRDKRVLGILLGSGAVLISVAGWSITGQEAIKPAAVSGCHIGMTHESGIRVAVAWICLFIYDSIIFTATIIKTYQTRYRYRGAWRKWTTTTSTVPSNLQAVEEVPQSEGSGAASRRGLKIPLVTLILRDGALYFAIMALSTLANTLTFYFTGPNLKGGLSTFASAMSVTMMSRLMLNLHRSTNIRTAENDDVIGRGMHFVDPVFTTVYMGELYTNNGGGEENREASGSNTVELRTLAWSSK